jgi:hypothetical protein
LLPGRNQLSIRWLADYSPKVPVFGAFILSE